MQRAVVVVPELYSPVLGVPFAEVLEAAEVARRRPEAQRDASD